MVDFFSFDPSFTSWTPSLEEFQSFTANNKYYNAKANLSSSVSTSVSALPPAPVHSYALKMTKRLISLDHRHSSVSFSMEETRTEVDRDESKCPICAVELKERQFLLNYQRLKENSKMVRNMCMRKEHPGTGHICTKHRPFEPSEGIPRCTGDGISRYPFQRSASHLPFSAGGASYHRGPVDLTGQPISVPGFNYHHRGPVDLTGQPISVAGEPKHLVRHPHMPHPAPGADQKLSVPKRTYKPAAAEPHSDLVSGYQFGLTIGSYSVREANKPKPFEPADQTTVDWFNYYRQPDVYAVRMDYTKAFDKPNEKCDSFPSKRMAARFDIDNSVKSDN